MKTIEEEIGEALAAKDRIYRKVMESLRMGKNTRAKTTTLNARIGDLNDRIQELRRIKKCHEN